MADSLSISSQIDSLVAQYRQSLKAKSVTRLEDRKITITARVSAIAELQAKLKALSATVKDLSGTGTTSLFQAFSAASSQTTVLTANATSAASVGTHSIKVTQLAKADTLVSSRFTSAGTSVADAEMTAEEKTAGQAVRQFRLMENGVEKGIVNVTIANGDTNATILSKVSAAVNESNGVTVGASVVSITGTESKLVLTSKTTGADHAFSLEDVSGTLLDNLGWGDTVISGRTAPSSSAAPDDPSGAPGGYLNTSASSLDAMFTVDGIDVRRGVNTVSDVLSGVTFDLRSVQQPADAAVNVAVSVDKDKIRSRIDKFITDYNAVIEYLNQKTDVDRTTGARQILAGDPTFTSLRTSMRSQVFSVVSSVTAGNPTLLAEIGITLSRTGTLSVTDTEAFTDALENDSSKVAQLFNSTDGIAVRLKSYLDTAIGAYGTSGTIESRRTSLNSQLTGLKTQITRVTDRIEKQVERFRTDFIKAQNLVAAATSQQQMISSLLSSFY